MSITNWGSTGRIFLRAERTVGLSGEGDASTLEISLSADLEAAALVKEFAGFMLALGYHPDTVRDALNQPDDVPF